MRMTNRDIIRAILKGYNLTVPRLARMVECDPSEIYRIIQGNRTGNHIMLSIYFRFPEYFNKVVEDDKARNHRKVG